MIELHLNNPLPPLHPFATLQLPNFTLITGLNGAGKTRLLTAIQEGDISADVDGIDAHYKILMHSGINMTPSELAPTGIAAPSDVRQEAWQEFSTMRAEHPEMLPKDGPDAVFHFESPTGELISFKFGTSGKTMAEITREDFNAAFMYYAPQVGMFQHSFAHLFVAWRRMRHEEIVKREEGAPAFTLEEFYARYGQPPWDILNRLLTDADLNIEVVGPNMLDMGDYYPYMRRRISGERLTMQTLSSGEKIMLSFVIALFNASERMVKLSLPSILLLDEPDAHLHPAMAQRILRLIQEVFVEKHGICVVATTHSPTMVALAPEESIYVMEADQPGLRKVSKAEALNALTVGVPTLAIDYDARRQVFTESDKDRVTYGKLYTLLETYLPPGRSLDFISTGASGAEGKDRVIKLVDYLSSSGNKTIYGVVDSDLSNGKTKSVAKDRIMVLADGVRDGMENVLLDPLLVAALIVHSSPVYLEKIGLSASGYMFDDFRKATHETLQNVVDKVTRAIFNDIGEKVACQYLGGFQLEIDRRCLETDDHVYELQVRSAFNNIKGNLLHAIIDGPLRQYPDILPIEARDVLARLLTIETTSSAASQV